VVPTLMQAAPVSRAPQSASAVQVAVHIPREGPPLPKTVLPGVIHVRPVPQSPSVLHVAPSVATPARLPPPLPADPARPVDPADPARPPAPAPRTLPPGPVASSLPQLAVAATVPSEMMNKVNQVRALTTEAS
jgi:hypothetical protein